MQAVNPIIEVSYSQPRPGSGQDLNTKQMNNNITIKNLSLMYGKKQVLKNINQEIEEKKITAIIGPSGCGKSTLLRCINRMNELIPETKVEGEILFHKKNIYAADTDVTEIRRKIGMVFQKPNPFPKSIFDNVAYGLRINGTKDKRKISETVEATLQDCGLLKEVKDRIHSPAMELSGGQQQRLCIARALAIEPEIILMDEPCSALDPSSTFKIEELMMKLKKRYTVIIVTHNMQQAARASDITGFLYMGKLIEYGDTNTLFTNPKEKLTEDYISGNFG
ncbi:phosphate ABC transporter ATP-binding protein [Candidatus Scalindua japonica]|uniref:Phosphate ABC transporter ATP-binding protein n=2 Tax=Candidatus Scalindua japonica TaxID=1284222 RepID=A0A286TVS7_9BACT|nr:phosphate ABC transporter ATP-binding protein PstB [Candidatus Scalindua japonica]GAX59982.1 phosphate ABC transporter ATP-binding protein [Candidatus Scalindua japonica]